ncbi:ComEA family DNA-binding protein [Gemmatimonadota bacterium]
MTPMEGRSLARGGMVLLLLSLLRLGLDRLPAHGPLVTGGPSRLPELMEESRAIRDEESRRGEELAPGERVDPNRAGEVELDRLPGLGPKVALSVVSYRNENGGFSAPEDLLEVPGIGSATLDRIRPHLDFTRGIPSGLRRVSGRTGAVRDEGRRTSTSPKLDGGASRERTPDRVDLNRASSQELQTLTGIGPALARRILESRARDGPFRGPEDLLRVRGIGPATLARIRDRISPGG